MEERCRLLGKGDLKAKINISVTGISKKAQALVEKNGWKSYHTVNTRVFKLMIKIKQR